MSDPFVAEIRIFPFAFAPRGWAQCNGQIMPIAQNTALFSLLGVTYGGDGKVTFALPNIQGRAVMAPGQGPGLSPHDLGEQGGTRTVLLSTPEMPQHTHQLRALGQDAADLNAPSPTRSLARSNGGNAFATPDQPAGGMSVAAVGLVGKSQAHNNMQPALTLNYCIALQGVFPQRP